jgi:hypothetical protein
MLIVNHKRESLHKIEIMKLMPLFLLICLIFPFNLLSQEENYDAVYFQLLKEYTLNPDGSMDYHYKKEMKLQTYRSFHNLYGETFIVYHPVYQSLKINEAYIIMADGKKVSSPKNAFNEVLPSYCANAPAYNAFREMVITHAGTERNAVINLDYTLHTAKDFFPAFMGNELMAEYEPVREMIIRVRIPLNLKLNYRCINQETEPLISEEGLFRVYSWKKKDVPAISPEEFQKGGYELYPRLIFSTATDRKNVYESFLKQEAFSYGINDEMKKAVADVMHDSKEKEDIVLKLQEKVVNEFRLWPVPLRASGYTCRSSVETWKSNGGTLIEKAVFLVSLLKEAGIVAEPVFVVRNSFYDDKIGSLLDIDDILIKATLKETEPIFLSVSTLNPQSMNRCLPGKTLVSLIPQGKIVADKPEEMKSILSMKANYTIDNKKQLTGDVSLTLTNACDPWFALLRDQGKMKTYVGGGLSSSDLKEQKTIAVGPAETNVTYSVQKDKPFRKDTNYYFYTLPMITNGTDSWGIKLLSQKRTASLEIPSLLEESYELNFNLPQGMDIFSPEKRIEISNGAGLLVFEVKRNEGKITVTKSISFSRRLIEPSIYNSFKALVDNWNSPLTKEIIFTGE